MDDSLKLKFKIGQIEFEAEGVPEDVNYQCMVFMDKLFPVAVDAMIRANGTISNGVSINSSVYESLPDITGTTMLDQNSDKALDATQLSINEFLDQKGFTSQIDTAIGLIYYNELVGDHSDFSFEDLKQYFKDAKIKVPANPSDVISKLMGKSYIMTADEKNRYKLTRSGISFVDTFVAKDTNDGKHKKVRKSRPQTTSVYANLTADDLNLQKYPQLKTLNSTKEQIIMAMYIVTIEGKGEWFTVIDIGQIMTNIFELPSSIDQINGVFKRNKSWFKSEQDTDNKRAYKHKLLSGGKDFAEKLINGYTVD